MSQMKRAAPAPLASTHARRHSVPDLRRSLISSTSVSSAHSASSAAAPPLARRAADDSIAGAARRNEWEYTLRPSSSSAITQPEASLRDFADTKGASIARRAAYYALRGEAVPDPRGNKRGSCGSLINRALAAEGLKEGQWASNGVPVCTVSRGGRIERTGDAIRPGDVIYFKDVTADALDLQFDPAHGRARILAEREMVVSGPTGHVGVVVSKAFVLHYLRYKRDEPRRRLIVEMVDQAVNPQIVKPHRVWVDLTSAIITDKQGRGRIVVTRPVNEAITRNHMPLPPEWKQQARSQSLPQHHSSQQPRRSVPSAVEQKSDRRAVSRARGAAGQTLVSTFYRKSGLSSLLRNLLI